MSTEPPLASASEIAPGNRPRAWFDDGLTFAIKEEARRRAPTNESIFNHQVGFAGELGTSAYLRGPVNREIYDDYAGDQGYDVLCLVNGEEYRVETKTVYSGNLELSVNRNKIDDADYFVLCRTTDPLSMVELIGWTSQSMLRDLGEQFPDDDNIRLTPSQLCGFEPLYLSPNRVRSAQRRS